MSTTTAPQTITDYIRTVEHADPKTALELAIAETERLKAESQARDREYVQQSEVKITEAGIEASNMAGLYRVAKLFAASDLVPDHFKRKPENCFIALQMAHRCRVDPFAFMQKCYLVHGRPAIETQLALAMINASGLIKGRVIYTLSGEGHDRKCVAKVVTTDTGETIEMDCTVKLAMDMGWWSKKDSLWPKMTDLMLRYRSALWLIRTTFPEVLMGLSTLEEERDIGEAAPATNGNGNGNAHATAGKGALDRLMERMSTTPPAPEPEQTTEPQSEQTAATETTEPATSEETTVAATDEASQVAPFDDEAAGLSDLFDVIRDELVECQSRGQITDIVNQHCKDQKPEIRQKIVEMGEMQAAVLRGKGKQAQRTLA
jgi:hypothetical protein